MYLSGAYIIIRELVYSGNFDWLVSPFAPGPPAASITMYKNSPRPKKSMTLALLVKLGPDKHVGSVARHKALSTAPSTY